MVLHDGEVAVRAQHLVRALVDKIRQLEAGLELLFRRAEAHTAKANEHTELAKLVTDRISNEHKRWSEGHKAKAEKILDTFNRKVDALS